MSVEKLRDLQMQMWSAGLSKAMEYGVPAEVMRNFKVVFKPRLGTSNGRIWRRARKLGRGRIDKRTLYNIRIEICSAVLDQFGEKDAWETFWHEMAHLIRMAKYGRTGHDAGFRDLCVKLGGTMNRNFARDRWAASATDSFVYVNKRPRVVICKVCGYEQEIGLSPLPENMDHCGKRMEVFRLEIRRV